MQSNDNKTLFLPSELAYQSITIPPEDAQFLETRKFSRSEVAGIYNVPAHMINDLEKATFSNISEQAIQFVRHTMIPWVVKWEQELNRKLFTEQERRAGYYVKFNLNGLLRGTAQERAEFYSKAIRDGWMTRNQVRELEDMNQADGLDTYLLSADLQQKRPTQMSKNLNEIFIRSDEIKIEKREDGEGPRIVGYAAKFNTRSNNLGGFVEVIAPGAFDDVLDDDVRALFNHDRNFVLGRTKAGTLELTVDEVGLRYEISPPDTQTVRDMVIEPMGRGDVNQSSLRFVYLQTVIDGMRERMGYISAQSPAFQNCWMSAQ